MRVVLALSNECTYVTFECRLNEPWSALKWISTDIPEILQKPIKFVKKIPENSEDILWEGNYNQVKVEKTDDIKHAVRFLKYKDRSGPTLKDLLEKYLAAANES